MNIAIIESEASITAGGAENSMASFCDFMIKSNHNIYLICEKGGTYSFEKLETIDTLIKNLQPLRVQGIISYCRSIYSIAKFVKKNKIELLLTHTIHAFPLIRFVKIFTGCKTVIYFKWVYNGNKIGVLNKWGLNGITTKIAINKYVADYWKKYLPYNSIFNYLPDGVRQPFNTIECSELTTNRVLYVGRIYEGKGLHILIKALIFCDPNIKLDVVGYFNLIEDHPNLKYHKFIHNLVNKYELNSRVTFHGYLSEFEYLYKSTELVVVPSILPDAQPLVILEAMARKKLVIGSKVGGILEIFTNDLNALLFIPDSNTLAMKIQSLFLMSNIEKRGLREKLYQKYLANYQINQTHNKLRNLINC